MFLDFEEAMQSNEIIAAQCSLSLPCSSMVSMVKHISLQVEQYTAKALRFPGLSKRNGWLSELMLYPLSGTRQVGNRATLTRFRLCCPRQQPNLPADRPTEHSSEQGILQRPKCSSLTASRKVN